MANIMVNELCNLQCPYCFANLYVNGDTTTDITYANFKKAVDWINEKQLRGDNPWPEWRDVPRIGIIGGEPTLHPMLKDLLMYAVRERLPNQEIIMFTNAYHIDEYIEFLAKNDIDLLINLNSPEDIGEKAYQQTVENIGKLRMNGVETSIGINFYKKDLDTKFVLDVIEKYSYRSLRVGLTSPNTREKVEAGSFAYFEDVTEGVVKLIEDCVDRGCSVHFDCQKIPACFMDRYEDRIDAAGEKVPLDVYQCSYCTPVIDILPDLQIARCFGVSSDKVTVPMDSFKKEEDVASYFATTIDNVAMLTCKHDDCMDCYERNIGKCQSGCLSFKLDDVLKLVKTNEKH